MQYCYELMMCLKLKHTQKTQFAQTYLFSNLYLQYSNKYKKRTLDVNVYQVPGETKCLEHTHCVNSKAAATLADHSH